MADHMMLRYREKADLWAQQAEKAQRRPYMDTITRFKFQDASHYQELAAQCFRAAKRFQDAGVAYKNSGRMEERLKKPEVAASFYHEAALCFKKDDPQEAAACYLTAVNLYCQIRRFSTAARLETKVAELMEKDRNRPLAIVHYIKAADFYQANTCCDAAADRCRLKVDTLVRLPVEDPFAPSPAAGSLGLSGRYLEAADLFEDVGRRMTLDDLLKFSSPETFLRGMLCLLCASGMPEVLKPPHRRDEPAPPPPRPRPTPKSIKAKLTALGKASPIFQGSRERAFGSDVARAAREGDMDLFATSVYAYDNVCRLDSWSLRLLKIISGHVEELSTKLTKIRAKEEKLRRMRAAEERARGRLKSRQPQPLAISGDTDSEASSVASTRETPDTQEKASGSASESSSSGTASSSSSKAISSNTGSSSTGSDSDSASSGSEASSSSSSSSADVSSPTETGSEGGQSEKAGSKSNSNAGSDSDENASRTQDRGGKPEKADHKKDKRLLQDAASGSKDSPPQETPASDDSANTNSDDGSGDGSRRVSSSLSNPSINSIKNVNIKT